jgi:hypothetical protein
MSKRIIGRYIVTDPRVCHVNTKAKRMGKVIGVKHTGLQLWCSRAEKEELLKWS